MYRSILFISDSLALPREKPETVTYEETYIGLLKSTYPNINIVQVSIGGAVLPELYRQANGYFSAYNPDLVIIQSGIVDCAPRTLTKNELEFILHNRILRKIWNKYLKPYKKRIRDFRKITYTNETLFTDYVEKMVALFGEKNICWIPILPASEDYEKRVAGITKNIEIYNKILIKILKYRVLNLNASCSWLMTDNHHLNAKGHLEIFRKLNSLISRC